MAYRVSFRTTSLVAGSTYDQNTFLRKDELPQEMRGTSRTAFKFTGGNSLDAVTPGLTLGTLYSSCVGTNG